MCGYTLHFCDENKMPTKFMPTAQIHCQSSIVGNFLNYLKTHKKITAQHNLKRKTELSDRIFGVTEARTTFTVAFNLLTLYPLKSKAEILNRAKLPLQSLHSQIESKRGKA